MTILNKTYEFEISEGIVYAIIPTSISNIYPSIHITGTGAVNLLGSVQIPTSSNDPILTLEDSDSDLFGFYEFEKTIPNYIKLEESQAGSRVITLKGFLKPTPLSF